MRVAIEEVNAMRERRREINDTPLEDIEWTLNGEVVKDISHEEIVDWKFTGLSNCDFVINRETPFIVQMFLTKE
jgi:hypothetical protein